MEPEGHIGPNIYLLIDPRDSRIHYVGCAGNPKQRLTAHIASARGFPRKNPRKARWIRDLLRQGLKPLLVEIEYPNRETAIIRERYWIETLASTGAPLSNCYPGNPQQYVVEKYATL